MWTPFWKAVSHRNGDSVEHGIVSVADSSLCKLGPSVSYVTEHRSVPIFPSISKEDGPSGAREYQWLDPTYIKQIYDIKCDAPARPKDYPWRHRKFPFWMYQQVRTNWTMATGVSKHLRAIGGGHVIEDLNYYKCARQMPDLRTPSKCWGCATWKTK